MEQWKLRPNIGLTVQYSPTAEMHYKYSITVSIVPILAPVYNLTGQINLFYLVALFFTIPLPMFLPMPYLFQICDCLLPFNIRSVFNSLIIMIIMIIRVLSKTGFVRKLPICPKIIEPMFVGSACRAVWSARVCVSVG